jgi:signal transduction histidine kinase
MLGLRGRVTLGFTLLGGVLSALIAAGTVAMAERYEHAIVGEILRSEVEDFERRLIDDPQEALPRTPRLNGFLRTPDGRGNVPTEFADLAPGIHEIERVGEHGAEPDEGVHVCVYDTRHGRLFFVVDLGDSERLEHQLAVYLAVALLFGTLLSGALGWWLAGRTIAPVRALAAAVESLPAQPRCTDLGLGSANDELGRLAHAIDGYQARLVEADAAERAFFADASHELRTPVAVVRGAAEVLAEQDDLDAATLQRIHRIDRGVGELGELVDVLLRLVRREPVEQTEVEIAQLLRDGAAPVVASVDGRHLVLSISASGMIAVPLREALLILHGVVRRLLPPAPVGMLVMTAAAGTLQITFQPETDLQAAPPRLLPTRSDRGLGLTLVGRLAARIGWRIDELSSTSGHRVVRITLPANPNTHAASS